MLTAITGINWGDEGKGRMVDLLSQDYDIVARYQGGGQRQSQHSRSGAVHSFQFHWLLLGYTNFQHTFLLYTLFEKSTVETDEFFANFSLSKNPFWGSNVGRVSISAPRAAAVRRLRSETRLRAQ